MIPYFTKFSNISKHQNFNRASSCSCFPEKIFTTRKLP